MATQVPENQGRALEAFLNVGDSIIKRSNRHDSKVKFLTLQAAIITNNHATFRKVGVSSGYQVPAGKKFIVVGQKTRGTTATVTGLFALNAGTTDIGFSSGSAASGLTLAPTVAAVFARDAATKVAIDGSLLFVVPAGYYLQLYANNNDVHVLVYGYEVDLSVSDLDQE